MTQLLKDFLANKKIEYRSVAKALVEQRNDLVEEMDGILNKAKGENRALEDAESTRFEEIRSEIAKIDKTLKAEEDFSGFEKREIKKPETEEEKRAAEVEKEERAFVDFVRGIAEGRATLSAGAQGVIIPQTIANRIIDTVKNMSPIISKATIWEVNGDLIIPSYDYTQHLPAGYYTELATMAGQAANFGTIKLSNLIVTSLALISKSLINRTDVDIVPFIVNEISKAMTLFLEKELLNNANSSAGSGAAKLGGLANASLVINGDITQVIDSAELVKMQLTIPQVYQSGAAWIMHPQTLAYIQSLKSTTGKFLMGNTLSEDGLYTLLGKPVYVSDQMPQMGVGANEIFYGDLSGLHIKMTKGLQMQVLNERFADQYAVGVVAAFECDSAIVEPQKIIKYVGK
ncbi:phage major capsid protein [Pullulanibacillus sp. KACC 23026]|uniref:phage major capsid protein n=1 Tax=Pullulanibacillus sp. KACC 23026 TaxID=3028315 RepID=UPI0023AF4079|nr:phage major capsid protein [Pullulanibacillus sp. KACC 23026]WEG13998.1 phage major capsid protein [Pullulanibacillus sp. KACC 23026]